MEILRQEVSVSQRHRNRLVAKYGPKNRQISGSLQKYTGKAVSEIMATKRDICSFRDRAERTGELGEPRPV